MTRLAMLLAPTATFVFEKPIAVTEVIVVMFTSSVSNAVNKIHMLLSTWLQTPHRIPHLSHSIANHLSTKTYYLHPRAYTSKITSYLIPTINYEQNSPSTWYS